MAIYRHLVNIPDSNGLPVDGATNTLYSNSATDAAAIVFAEVIADTFTLTPAGDAHSISEYIHADRSRATDACQVRTYKLSDPEPRAPINIATFTLDPYISLDSLPSQAAGVLSFRAAVASGANMARRRGRVYIGPLIAAATTTSPTSGETYLSNDFVDVVLDAFHDGLGATGEHVVYSPTTVGEGGGGFFPVERYWMDNSPDVIRKRKIRPSVRYTRDL